MLFMVIQKPKAKYRAYMATAFVIVEADSKAEAIRKAIAEHGDYITKNDGNWVAPMAKALSVGLREFV